MKTRTPDPPTSEITRAHNIIQGVFQFLNTYGEDPYNMGGDPKNVSSISPHAVIAEVYIMLAPLHKILGEIASSEQDDGPEKESPENPKREEYRNPEKDAAPKQGKDLGPGDSHTFDNVTSSFYRIFKAGQSGDREVFYRERDRWLTYLNSPKREERREETLRLSFEGLHEYEEGQTLTRLDVLYLKAVGSTATLLREKLEAIYREDNHD